MTAMTTEPHPADWEGQASSPTEQPRGHNPAEQVQPPDADDQDLYGEPAGQ